MSDLLSTIQHIVAQLAKIDEQLETVLAERDSLAEQITALQQENMKLKDTIKASLFETENCLQELEEIRVYYANRHDNN